MILFKQGMLRFHKKFDCLILFYFYSVTVCDTHTNNKFDSKQFDSRSIRCLINRL